jgi:predicted Rossmann-fold nucleotide-binding protein
MKEDTEDSVNRRTIIGVMGGDDTVGAIASEAKLVGAAVTRAERILLTGGCVVENTKVKDAAMTGAEREGLTTDRVARLIGILPDGPRCWNERGHCLFLSTNLNHMERDAINGVTPDVLIFFAGSSGTLCELAFALQAQKPILFWRATETLRSKQRAHVADGDMAFFLTSALQACREKLGVVPGISHETTVPSLLSTLALGLSRATDFSGDVNELVGEAIRQAGLPKGPTGFPGFRGEMNSKARFEEVVERISA